MTLPAHPIAPCHVAFEGFGEFEREALASFFRLADPRVQAHVQRYRPVGDAGQAELLVVNADRPAAVEAVRAARRTRDAVFVGTKAPPDAVAWLTRPIDPMHIVRELDVLAEQQRDGRFIAPGPGASSEVDLLLEDIGTSDHTEARGGEAKIRATLRAPRPGGCGREVLVVDDSAIARRFLAQRLERFGYRVQLAASGEQALSLLEQRPFTITFVDITLGPANVIDGLQVCRSIKQRARAGSGTAVVIVTGHSSATARVRASLVGCDAFLAKPLMEHDFIAALRQVDPLFEWEVAAA